MLNSECAFNLALELVAHALRILMVRRCCANARVRRFLFEHVHAGNKEMTLSVILEACWNVWRRILNAIGRSGRIQFLICGAISESAGGFQLFGLD